ncbi:hypothetical protein ACPA9J_05660 [Pseudomonas aeruginosa]
MQDLDPVENPGMAGRPGVLLDREGEDRAHYLMTRMGELTSRRRHPTALRDHHAPIATPFR